MSLRDIKDILQEIIDDIQAGRSAPAAVPLVEEPADISVQDMRRVVIQVELSPALQEATDLEPQVMHLLKIAALSQDSLDNRWHRYELLKNLGMSLVGWEARDARLSTSEHYESYLRAVDALLPEPLEETA